MLRIPLSQPPKRQLPVTLCEMGPKKSKIFGIKNLTIIDKIIKSINNYMTGKMHG